MKGITLSPIRRWWRAHKTKEFAMMQDYKNNIKNFELQQKQIIMMGGSVNTKQKKLSVAEIEKLKKDYRHMYFAFVSINWGMGKTLGVSWQKALEQMDSFVATKLKIVGHPINNELIKYNAEFKRDMSKHIMTSEYAQDTLSEQYKKIFFDDGEKQLKKSKAAIDSVYQQYMPEKTIEKTLMAHKFNLGQQKTQYMLQQILINQRAA